MSQTIQDLMLGGQVQQEELVTLIKAFKIPSDSVTLMLLEMQPRFVVKSEQRQDLLLLGEFNSAVNTASYTSGRIFHIYGELRWERQGKHIQVVYTGDRAYTPALNDSEEMVLEYKPIIRSYFLFGKWLDEGELKRIGPAAQSGDFAEVRISRLLRYPALPALAGAQYIQLAVCEYSDPITGVNIAYRFKKLVPFQKSKEQEKI